MGPSLQNRYVGSNLTTTSMAPVTRTNLVILAIGMVVAVVVNSVVQHRSLSHSIVAALVIGAVCSVVAVQTDR